MNKAQVLADPAGLAQSLDQLRGHVVLCNINEKLSVIINDLHRDTQPNPVAIVVLVQDLQLWKNQADWHAFDAQRNYVALYAPPSDPRSLQLAQIARARAAIILADPRQGDLADARATLVAVSIEKQNPQVHTVMELLSSLHRAHLANTEVDEVVCLGDLSEKLIAQSCITPGVGGIFDRLLGARESTSRFYLPALPAQYVGLSYRELWQQSIREHWPLIVCGFVRPAQNAQAADSYVLNPTATQEPGRDTKLAASDRLIVIANHLVKAESFARSLSPSP